MQRVFRPMVEHLATSQTDVSGPLLNEVNMIVLTALEAAQKHVAECMPDLNGIPVAWWSGAQHFLAYGFE